MDHHRLAVNLNDPTGGATYAKNQLRQLGATRAHQPGEADDLPGAHVQADRVDFAAVGEVLHVEAGFARGNVALFIKQVAERTAHHHAHQFASV